MQQILISSKIRSISHTVRCFPSDNSGGLRPTSSYWKGQVQEILCSVRLMEAFLTFQRGHQKATENLNTTELVVRSLLGNCGGLMSSPSAQ